MSAFGDIRLKIHDGGKAVNTLKIIGTGSALPKRCVSNADMTEWVETSDDWIRERTGIRQRYLSTGETVVSLAVDAARKAMEQAGKEAGEIDLILTATCSPEYLFPCTACQIQEQLGADHALAFDLNAACSGFLFALATAEAYLASGRYRNALVIGSEVLSKLIDWTDRSTCVLFGDGAGAVLVEACKEQEGMSGLLASSLHSEGNQGKVLSARVRRGENPLYIEEGCTQNQTYIQMEGQAVYRFATRQVPICIQDALEEAKLAAGEIDLFVLHQANIRILEVIARRLGIDMEKVPFNLDRVGNMSSASIPVLLDELNRAGKLKRGDKVVLAGFGAGLTYGACVLVW